ncbi:MAG: thioredoxin domain-containing protein, partial [Acidobacteriota bacterium]
MPSREKHANRLIHESSPYLLQHAHNPVDWYAWGEEALSAAREQDKPIFLSIGYSACHWCHVMEDQSFEDEEIAVLMNENFINIKVDREERPDLDAIYMNFVQMTTGSGGWPLTVFLSPDQVPFYGGTYFPPEDSYGRPGFKRVLRSIAETYRTRGGELEKNREEIVQRLKQVSRWET